MRQKQPGYLKKDARLFIMRSFMSVFTISEAEKLISSTEAPYVFFCKQKNYRLSGFTDFDHKSDIVIIASGSNMRDWDEFSASIADIFSFPSYYGKNWDAMDDCLTDLSWMEFKRFFLIIPNAEKIFIREPKEFDTFLDVLKITGEYWGTPVNDGEWWDRGAIPFHTMLVYADDVKPKINLPEMVL